MILISKQIYISRFNGKLCHDERTQLTRGLITYLNKFAEPYCIDSEISALTVHAVMQAVALFKFDKTKESFELSLESQDSATRRKNHKIPRLIVEGRI